jgi:predicted regulator of amino acid metabolism with ACT domain
MSTYQEMGYSSRRDYLDTLADEMGVDRTTVYAMAQMLGPNEDFDGLVTSLEDYVEGY